MAILLFFVFLLTSATNSVTATNLQAFIYKTCSNNQTTNLTLNALFTTLASQASTTNYFQTTISHSKCYTCVQTLTNTIETSCYTARAQLLGCYMWYELDAYHVDYPPVNGPLHEQCGVLSGTGSPFDISKNDALNDLVDSVGNKRGYYAKRYLYYPSKYVEVYVNVLGQCEADLGVDDCVNCVKTAVGFAQTDCGSSFRGDVYLQKCYISYSDGGDNDGGNAGGLVALLVAVVFVLLVF